MSDITWTTERRKIGDLREWERNPRQLSRHDAEHLNISLTKFGVADPLVINADGQLIGGHMRRRVMLQNGSKPGDLVDVRVPSRQLSEEEAAELAIRLNRGGSWDFDALANNFEMEELQEWGFTLEELQITPNFEPVGIEEQGRLDEKKKVICPECGHEFTP